MDELPDAFLKNLAKARGRRRKTQGRTRSRSPCSLISRQVTGFSLQWIAHVKEAAPSPYIGERVAYRTRNPNGIFD